MSYCRWSSDDFNCDLYCYAHCGGGYTTHVASNRIVGDIPPLEPDIMSDEWMPKYQDQMGFLDGAERKNIGLPYDGESFNDPTLEEFLERLLHLREVGYNFPDYVLGRIMDEIVMESPQPTAETPDAP